MYVKYEPNADPSFLNSSSSLKPMIEFKGIHDWDDKFGLDQIQDPKLILKHLDNANYNYKTNDLIYFFKKLAQL